MYEVAGNGRWSENGDGGTRTHIGLVASEVLFQLSDVPAMKCGRVESNHHSARRRGYSPLSSPVLSVRMKRGDRPDSNRYREDHDLGCCRYTTATTSRKRAGTTGLEPAAYRLTSECSRR
jgi:hypothetical protein